jgi:hypothetical protein
VSSPAALSLSTVPPASADSTMLASEATMSTHASATAVGGAGAQVIVIG